MQEEEVIMSTIRFPRLVVVLGVLVLAVPTLRAQEVHGSGSNMFIPKVLQSFELPDGTTANRMTYKGFMSDQNPSSPLHLASMVCEGTTINAKDGTQMRGAGYCDSVDAQGDVAFYWWRGDGKGGNWGFMGGTGKWSNVEGGGTYEASYLWKDGRFANNWKGSWKTK
jgi:hypothetical protein